MANYCIPKHIAASMKEAIKAGKLSAKQLLEMSDEDRATFFSKFLEGDGKGGKFLSDTFKSEVSLAQQKSLSKWIGKNTDPGLLDSFGTITPKNADKVAQVIADSRHGLTLSDEEVKTIGELHQKVADALVAHAEKADGSVPKDYFTALRAQQDYINSLRNSSLGEKYRSYTALSILVTPASMIKSYIGNFENMIMQRVETNVQAKTFRGLNNDAAKTYFKQSIETYQKTGILPVWTLDPTMGDLEYSRNRSTGVLGVVSDLSTRYTHGMPHAVSATSAFINTVNKLSTKAAYDLGIVDEAAAKAKSREIFNDAVALKPTTEEGRNIRLQAVADAAQATNMNKSAFSNGMAMIKLGTEKMLGKNVADFMFKVVKVPANIAYKSVDYSLKTPLEFGLGAVRQIFGGAAPENWAQITAKAAVSGGLYLTSMAMVSAIGPENYQGIARTPEERKIRDERGAKNNSIKIPGVGWVSLGYMGVLAPLMSGMFAAQQSKGSTWQKLSEGSAGFLEGVYDEMPISGTAMTLLQDVAGGTYAKSGTDIINNLVGDTVGSLYHFVVPTTLSQAAIATDPYQRNTSGSLDYFKSEVPGLREDLPIKRTESGEPMKQEWLRTFLTGAQTSPATDTPTALELKRLNDKGYGKSLSDPTNLALFKNLKSQKGDATYTQALNEYYSALSSELDTLVQSPEYKVAKVGASNPSQTAPKGTKLYMIQNLETKLQDKIKKDYTVKTPASSRIASADTL